MLLTALVVVISSAILCFVSWCISYRIKFRCLDHIPGPKPLPVLGNILDIGQNPVEILCNIHRIMKKYGPISKVWIGPNKLYLFLTDPEIIEFFISSPKYIKKGDDYKLFKPWLGNGLLISDGNYWQKRRKIITPSFHFKILEEFMPIFHEQGSKLLNNLTRYVDKGAFNIYPLIQTYTLDVICETAMGTSVNAQENPNNEYVQTVKTLTRLITDRMFSAWKQFDFLYKYSSCYKEETKALNIVHSFTKSVIEKRRNQLLQQNSNNKTESTNDVGQKKRVAFLDMLLSATINGHPLTNEDIMEEVDTFMFEGHDTSASGISFALCEISRHQTVQNKIVEELKDIFGDDVNREPILQDFNNMKYLELVIKETMRLYPPVPMISRRLQEDAYYKGMRYPKGTYLGFQIYVMHRQEGLFKNADQFYPERFLDDNMIKRNPFSYLPFSAGPRNCIGQKFAMYEMKATLSNILCHYELLPAGSMYDMILEADIILKSENGMSVKIQSRQW